MQKKVDLSFLQDKKFVKKSVLINKEEVEYFQCILKEGIDQGQGEIKEFSFILNYYSFCGKPLFLNEKNLKRGPTQTSKLDPIIAQLFKKQKENELSYFKIRKNLLKLDTEVEEDEVLVKMENKGITRCEQINLDLDGNKFPHLKNILVVIDKNMKEALTIFRQEQQYANQKEENNFRLSADKFQKLINNNFKGYKKDEENQFGVKEKSEISLRKIKILNNLIVIQKKIYEKYGKDLEILELIPQYYEKMKLSHPLSTNSEYDPEVITDKFLYDSYFKFNFNYSHFIELYYNDFDQQQNALKCIEWCLKKSPDDLECIYIRNSLTKKLQTSLKSQKKFMKGWLNDDVYEKFIENENVQERQKQTKEVILMDYFAESSILQAQSNLSNLQIIKDKYDFFEEENGIKDKI